MSAAKKPNNDHWTKSLKFEFNVLSALISR